MIIAQLSLLFFHVFFSLSLLPLSASWCRLFHEPLMVAENRMVRMLKANESAFYVVSYLSVHAFNIRNKQLEFANEELRWFINRIICSQRDNNFPYWQESQTHTLAQYYGLEVVRDRETELEMVLKNYVK